MQVMPTVGELTCPHSSASNTSASSRFTCAITAMASRFRWEAAPFLLTEVAATLKHLNWKGWVLNEEEREDGSKQGLSVMEPAFQALQKAFPQ